MIVLGVDPDTRGSGVALVYVDRQNIDLISVETTVNPDLRARGEEAIRQQAQELSFALKNALLKHDVDLCVVERQEVYKRGNANANNLVTLANISGVALGICSRGPEIYLPLPKCWKGQQPKGITWSRVLETLDLPHNSFDRKGLVKPRGIEWPYSAEVRINDMFVGEALDAIGLAIWGGRKFLGLGSGPLK